MRHSTNVWKIRIDNPKLLVASRIVIRVGSELSEDALRKIFVNQATVGSADQFEGLWKSRLPGIPLKPLHSQPREIPYDGVPEVDPTVPRDRMADVLGGADVLIWTADDAETAALTVDPIIAEQGPRNVFTGRDLAAAIAFSSPLSLPLVADQLPPMLRTALA